MTITELVERAHANAKAKGFWDGFGHNGFQQEVSMRLMLIVSELGEAVEALRHDNQENFYEEMADVAIRLADLCGGLNIDLEFEIEAKMETNARRPRLHGKGF